MVDQSKQTSESSASRLEMSIPVSEHIEEVSVGGQRVRRRGVYLLPSIVTMGALFAGFYGVVAAMNGQFESAVLAVIAAGFLDGMDGRVARLTNTQSAFGAELDSLADMVSFGVAPALVVFSWGLGPLGRFGWAFAFIYIAGAALRLARFNTQIDTADKRFFSGLASPAAAGLIVSMVWLAVDRGLEGTELPLALSVVAGIATASAGVLMVTNIPYHSFKGVNLRGRVPFVIALLVPLVFAVIMVDPPLMLLIIGAAYACSGPVQKVWSSAHG
jgi:CDP-diacylglycerol--serine O-phosphatidyltransferase